MRLLLFLFAPFFAAPPYYIIEPYESLIVPVCNYSTYQFRLLQRWRGAVVEFRLSRFYFLYRIVIVDC